MSRFEKNEVSVCKYTPENRQLWDSFISDSKNGIFLFYRDYMEYHSDRFHDNSLIFFKDGKVVGLLPANITDATLYSHEGLTFGGIISNFDMTTSLMMEIFEKLVDYCREQGISKIFYKSIPHIYHSIPAEEDLYALFRCNAKLKYRTVSSSIYLPKKIGYACNKKRSVGKAIKSGLVIRRSFDFSCYMKIVEKSLMDYHGVKPVHTAKELKHLADRFPENMKLFSSFKDGSMLAGVIVYENANVAHAQYGTNSEEGKSLGAEDAVFNYLINDYYKYSDKKYFDFGISNEKFGRVLNCGLIRYKEEFGARAVTYDCYQLSLRKQRELESW